MKVNYKFNQKQFSDELVTDGWTDSKQKNLNKLLTFNGHTYQVIQKLERKLSFFSFRRITGIALALFCTVGSLGLAPFLSKFVRQLYSGRQVLRIIKEPSLPFLIEANKRAGNDKPIFIPIGDCKHLSLKEEHLGKIFQIANRVTLNTRYPIQDTSRYIDNRLIHRPNHNGTHSSKQVRCLEAVFDLIEKRGFRDSKALLTQLTTEERINLKLAAFFLRAGRVDESSHKTPPADDYYTRSALIYEAYARQLGVNKEGIEWAKRLIIDSCKPLNLCKEANRNPKSKFAYDLLTTVHELDLVRCFPSNEFAVNALHTVQRLTQLVYASHVQFDKLVAFAKELCKATGSGICVDHYKEDPKRFADCSEEGEKCWREVQKVAIPIWK